jgi:hypothetical protein
MNTDIDDSDCIVVQKGGGEVGKRNVEVVGSPDPANDDASVPSPEPGEGAEESRGGVGDPREAQGPQGRPKRVVGRPKKVATPAVSFEAATEAGRKRTAEWSLTDQVAGLRALIEGLAKQHQEREEHLQDEIRSLKKETGELKVTIQAWREEQLADEKAKKQDQKAFQTAVQKEHQKQGTAVQEVQALLKEKDKRPSYSDIARTPAAQPEQPWTTVERRKGLQLQPFKDERAVTIDAGRTKAEKTDYTIVKARLQEGLANIQATAGLKIECLRPGPGDRIEVVFATKAQADKARKHSRWVTSQMPGTRIQGDEWYPVKCDLVAKQAVLEGTAKDGISLRQDVCKDFQAQNSVKGIDCAAMKARWISRADSVKKTGSLVIWLKHKTAASHLLEKGTAIFGATGSYCSKWESRDYGLLCFNCNKHGHLQAACKVPPRCAICSGSHRRFECKQQANPKCPVCNQKGHTALSWECSLHPQHWKFKGKAKANSSSRTQSTGSTVPATSQPSQGSSTTANTGSTTSPEVEMSEAFPSQL